jgi:hypothetical protein
MIVSKSPLVFAGLYSFWPVLRRAVKIVFGGLKLAQLLRGPTPLKLALSGNAVVVCA